MINRHGGRSGSWLTIGIGDSINKSSTDFMRRKLIIHMVLGYLCERRIATRRVRLDQIVQELFEAGYPSIVSMDRYHLKKRLKWAASVQQPSMIAGSTAKVLEILLNSLSAHCQSISEYLPEAAELEKKIDHIGNLILRGHKFVRHLARYADSFEGGKAIDISSDLEGL